MTSKRDLKREVEALSEETDSVDDVGMYLFETENNFETRSEAPRPELTVPDTLRGGYETAVPGYAVPEEYHASILCVRQAVIDTWPGDDDAVPISELWDSMTEAELREEYRLRRENNDAIPPLLEEYETE